MTILGNEKNKSLQKRLNILFVITLALSVILRFMAGGWILIICGIPLMIIIAIHAIIQVKAIKNVPYNTPFYVALIVLSNLLMFIGFTFQVDGGDSGGARIPILFWKTFDYSELPSANLFQPIVVTAFLFLLLNWIALLMLRKPALKQES